VRGTPRYVGQCARAIVITISVVLNIVIYCEIAIGEYKICVPRAAVLDTRFKNVARRGRRWNKKKHGPRFFEVRINLRRRRLYFKLFVLCVYRNFFRTLSNNIHAIAWSIIF